MAVGSKGIEELLEDGLAEGRRLAIHAREVLRSRYQDWMISIAVVGLLTWVALLLAPLILTPGADGIGTWAALISVAMAAVTASLLYLTMHRFTALIAEQDGWVDRLSWTPQRGANETRFDLLVEVSEQVPAWLSIIKKDRFRSHPFLTTGGSIAGAATGILVSSVITNREGTALPYFLGMLALFTALSILFGYALSAALRRDEKARLERWKQRMEASRQAMEEILGGL